MKRILWGRPGPAQRALLVLLVAMLSVPQTIPSTITVTGTDSAVGTDGVCSLREAIANANADVDSTGGECVAGSGPDTIELSADVTLTLVDNSTEPTNANGLPLITTNVTIDGNDFTIARDPGAPRFRIFQVTSSGTLTLNDTTVSASSADQTFYPENGGGILNFGTLTLTNSTVANSAANYGGGIDSSGGTTLTDSTVSGNSSFIGGGIFNRGTLTLTNSTVSGNSCDSRGGGGIYSYGLLTLTNSTVSGNSSGKDGGGIFNASGGPLTLTNSTVSGNSSGEDGGGIFNYYSGPLTLTNSTVSGNSANQGGGIFLKGTNDTVTLTNSIVANSTGGDCAGQSSFTDGGANFTEDGSCPGAPIVSGVDIDPLLADNGGPTLTHALLPGSVAVDAAGVCGLPADQRGVLRDDGACDSGAYEFNIPPAIPMSSPWSLLVLGVGLLAVLPVVASVMRRREYET